MNRPDSEPILATLKPFQRRTVEHAFEQLFASRRSVRPRSPTIRLRSQSVILKKGRGQHSKYRPYAFEEHGALMLGNVLRSASAISVRVLIVRAFVPLRTMLAIHAELANTTKIPRVGGSILPVATIR